jgi:hypothetical protein
LKEEAISDNVEEAKGEKKDAEMAEESSKAKALLPQTPTPEQEKRQALMKANWKKFNPFEPSDYLQTLRKPKGHSPTPASRTQAMRVEQEMTQYKQSLLPSKRSLYGSLYKGDLNRYAQSNLPDGQSLYIDPQEIQDTLYKDEARQKKLVDRLVNGINQNEELSSEESSSDDSGSDSEQMEGIERVKERNATTMTQMYVQTELKAVMRIKQQFFKWFEEFFTKTMQTFLGNDAGRGQGSGVSEAGKRGAEQLEIQEPYFQHFDKHDSESNDSVVSCSEDFEISNPQSHLTCLLCKQKGEFAVTGRLIPYKLNMYVHTSCALWTNEVFDVDDGQIINFYQQQNKLIHQKCSICSEQGATISCARTKGCNKNFHFPCAYRSGKVKFTKSSGVFCEACNKMRGGGHNASTLNHSGVAGASKQIDAASEDQDTNLFPYEYLKKKRLYIVNNFAEISLQEYENEIENQQAQEQSSQVKANQASRSKDRNPDKDSKRGEKNASRKKEKEPGL